MKSLETTDLIAQLRKGNNDGLEHIIREYRDWCVNGLLKKTDCSPDEAYDIFIEAVLNLRERILAGKVEHLTSIKNYLYGTCYNMWLNSYKKRKKQYASLSDAEWYYQNEAEEEFGIDGSTAELWRKKMLSVSQEAIAALGENCRKVISYFYIERRSMVEIAEIMNFSSQSVAKTTKFRCFKKLMEEVEKLKHKLY